MKILGKGAFIQMSAADRGVVDEIIEKACTYLDEKCRKFILTAKDIDDFRNYMKGE